MVDERMLTAPERPTGHQALVTPSPGYDRDFLESVKAQVQAMRNCLDPSAFSPAFGRTMTDSCPLDDPLTHKLSDALELYSRIKPKDVLSKR